MKQLSKTDIYAVDDSELVEHEVKEWGGAVYLAVMTVEERLKFDEKYCDETGKFANFNDPKLIYELLATCVKDAEGKSLFDTDDIGALKNKNSKVINAIFYKIMKINYQVMDDIKKK